MARNDNLLRKPARVQLDKQMRMSWDAHLVAAVALGGRRLIFWLARHRWQVALAAVLIWLGRLLWDWYQRGGMPLP